jgi:type II secretory pathway pseudopilin PulG
MEKGIMKNILKCNRGITLVELLSALALVSLILIMAGSIHFFAQNQSNKQSEEIANQTNARLAMKTVTKEIRSAEELVITDGAKRYNVDRQGKLTEQNITSAIGFEIIKNGVTTVYKYENETLKRNGQDYIKDLERFELRVNSPKTNQISISVANLPDTIINIRK